MNSNHNPIQTQAGDPLPSTSCPQQSHTGYSSHTPTESLDKDGNGVKLLAVVLPATNLLSGSADTAAVVLELASFESRSGVRKAILNWHGPFPTQLAASEFVAQLAAQIPKCGVDPIADQMARASEI